ncbi:MAG TPA: GNAT family N-acetyltransferase [Gemmatimonadales bacterium]|nr:GNAT family N-acetyltransferase [Gemmatimonadales bacterium]
MCCRPGSTRATTRLEPPRLTLVACAPDHLIALREQPDRFHSLVGFPIAPGIHAFYDSNAVSAAWLEALRAAAGTPPDPWQYGFFIVETSTGTVIGSAGFKGPPDAEGMVEIAYGVDPSRQGQGFATEAAGALVRYAAADPRVRLLRAHTLPEANASTRVLRKCGFVHIGGVVDPDDGPVWRWERSAPHIGVT